jgi:ArsR family transcriptional regulator
MWIDNFIRSVMSERLADRVYEIAAELFAMLAAPTRLRIVCALMAGERNVGQLVEQLAVSQPNISQHLNMLYRAGVLARRRTGSQIYYRVEHEQVRELCLTLLSGMPADARPPKRRRAGKEA